MILPRYIRRHIAEIQRGRYAVRNRRQRKIMARVFRIAVKRGWVNA